MKARKIYITAYDKTRLEELVTMVDGLCLRIKNDLDALSRELARAEIVDPKSVHPNVVTMNSRVTLQDLDTKEEMTYVLAFPSNANVDMGAVSVLAPVGTAILGYSKGDVVEWPVLAGTRRILIKDILYQPEAAGDFHL